MRDNEYDHDIIGGKREHTIPTCRCSHSRSRHVYRADDWFECGSCNECKKFAEEVDYAT